MTLVAATLVAGCGGGDEASDATSATTAATADGSAAPEDSPAPAFPNPCDHLTPAAVSAVVGEPTTESSRSEDTTRPVQRCHLEIGTPDDSFDVELSWARPRNGGDNIIVGGPVSLPDISANATDNPDLSAAAATVNDVQFAVQAFVDDPARIELLRQLIAAFPG